MTVGSENLQRACSQPLLLHCPVRPPSNPASVRELKRFMSQPDSWLEWPGLPLPDVQRIFQPILCLCIHTEGTKVLQGKGKQPLDPAYTGTDLTRNSVEIRNLHLPSWAYDYTSPHRGLSSGVVSGGGGHSPLCSWPLSDWALGQPGTGTHLLVLRDTFMSENGGHSLGLSLRG